jgi:hypothetical protein
MRYFFMATWLGCEGKTIGGMDVLYGAKKRLAKPVFFGLSNDDGRARLLWLFYHVTRNGEGNIATVALYENRFGKGSGSALAVVFSGDYS